MSRDIRWIGVLVCCLLWLGTSSLSAQTNPKVETPDFSAHAEVADVAEDLDKLWRDSPEIFEAVATMRHEVQQWYRHRGQRPMNVARPLNALGEEALLAMLWALVDDDPMELGMGLQAWRSWRIGLLEAVGRLRDERSIPVLRSIIAGAEPYAAVREVATSAMGRIGDESAIGEVIEIAEASPDKRAAIVAGLGDARRAVALDYLLMIIDRDSDAAYHRQAIRSLGDWANQWAWQSSTRQSYLREWKQGRLKVIEGLIEIYPQADGSTRAEIAKSLQLAGAALAEKRLIERAQGTDDVEEQRLWSELATSMAESPMD